MRFGLITPVCVRHGMQQEAIACNREFSEPTTPYLVIWNGIDPLWELPEGVTGVQLPTLTDEQDLWQWCLDYAVEQGWDWCMVVHDDFAMREAGWEQQLRNAEGWRIAVASWCAYTVWTDQANSACPVDRRMPTRGQPNQEDNEPQSHDAGQCHCDELKGVSQIGVCVDSFSFGFRTDVFTERGCVIGVRWGYGYGAWDACAWALQQGYAMWGLVLNSWHHWENANSRELMHVGAPGHPAIGSTWKGIVLPARVVDAQHIETAGRTVYVGP